MITALRVTRGILAFFIVWQIVTLTDILVGIMLNSDQPLGSYIQGAIAGKMLVVALFSAVVMKSRKYINALHQQKGNTSLLLKDWYSI